METIFDHYWHTSYDRALDFWSVCMWSGDIEYQVAAALEKEVAEHLVNLHNAWWDGIVEESYADNYMATYDRELTEFYDEQARIKSLTEDSWFNYDDPRETT